MASDINNNLSAWDKEARYIASAVNNLMVTMSPDVIVLGGTIMEKAGLIESVRVNVNGLINNDISFPRLEPYVVKSSSNRNGVKAPSHWRD